MPEARVRFAYKAPADHLQVLTNDREGAPEKVPPARRGRGKVETKKKKLSWPEGAPHGDQ